MYISKNYYVKASLKVLANPPTKRKTQGEYRGDKPAKNSKIKWLFY